MPKKQPYRISADLKHEYLFNFLNEVAEEFYDGNTSKAIRNMLKKGIKDVNWDGKSVRNKSES